MAMVSIPSTWTIPCPAVAAGRAGSAFGFWAICPISESSRTLATVFFDTPPSAHFGFPKGGRALRYPTFGSLLGPPISQVEGSITRLKSQDQDKTKTGSDKPEGLHGTENVFRNMLGTR